MDFLAPTVAYDIAAHPIDTLRAASAKHWLRMQTAMPGT